MRVHNALIVVTGASPGVGAATALELARRRGRLVLVARDHERLRAIANQIESVGGYAATYAVDLGEARAVARLAEDVLAREGPPDVPISNAGAGRWLSVDETTASDLERMMAVLYFAAFNLTREFMPAMRGRLTGHIVM